MINPSSFFNLLQTLNINQFYGVPDSLLKDICGYISDNVPIKNHLITANEGNAAAMACGYYLATKKPAVVYLQNSGLGNCINVLLSLSDKEVYNIPFLMIIGWRGKPGTKDEPQHIKQGILTEKMLELCDIKYSVLPRDISKVNLVLNEAVTYMNDFKKPYALLVEKNTFDKYVIKNHVEVHSDLTRELAIKKILSMTSNDSIIVATTGHISREIYEIREMNNESHQSDFLCVGSMGHASSIALSIANAKPNHKIVCFDGDGACLMHMGALAVNGTNKLKNLKHVILNNSAHDSVGGQPTCFGDINVSNLAQSCGYENVLSVANLTDLNDSIPSFLFSEKKSFLEVKVKCGSRKNLGRPKEKPVQNKHEFMSFLNP